MGQEWHYSKDGKRAGPISASELKRLASTGEIQPSDQIWKQGMKEWVSASSVKGLFTTTSIMVPPPLPAVTKPAVTKPVTESDPFDFAAPGSSNESDSDSLNFGVGSESSRSGGNLAFEREDDDDFDDSPQFRCPFCRAKHRPRIESQVSQGGWVFFIVSLLFCLPLFWIPLVFMKEEIRKCVACGMKLG